MRTNGKLLLLVTHELPLVARLRWFVVPRTKQLAVVRVLREALHDRWQLNERGEYSNYQKPYNEKVFVRRYIEDMTHDGEVWWEITRIIKVRPWMLRRLATAVAAVMLWYWRREIENGLLEVEHG